MSGKNRIAEVVEVSTAILALISLTMRLSFILTSFDHGRTITLGAANSALKSAFDALFHSISHHQSGELG
jgi:hypothetical protein